MKTDPGCWKELKAEEDDLPGDTTSVYNNYVVPVPRTSVTSTGARFFLRAFRTFYNLAALLQSLGNWSRGVTSSVCNFI